MNLVCDEGVERQIVDRLRADGHEVLYVAELEPGVDDQAILSKAVELSAPVVTNDKDFGELVFRQALNTSGVILLRLAGLSNHGKAETVAAALRKHEPELGGAFTVIAPGRVRIRSRLTD